MAGKLMVPGSIPGWGMFALSGGSLAALPIGGVNLPQGEQRRRTDTDRMNMRAMFTEGDLLSAEVSIDQEYTR